MHFRITGDTDVNSGLGSIIDGLSGPTRKHFLAREYGPSLLGIVVVLVCQDPDLKLKQRIKFAKTERKLYLDILLDFGQMQASDPEGRKQVVLQRILDEVPIVLAKYSMEQFDEERFLKDLRDWLIGQETAGRGLAH